MTSASHKPGDKMWVVDSGRPCEVEFVSRQGRTCLASTDTSGHVLERDNYDAHENELDAVRAAIEERKEHIVELTDDINAEARAISTLTARLIDILLRGAS